MNLNVKMKGSTKAVPVWLWFFVVFAVSSFVGLLMYLDFHEKGGGSGPDASKFSDGISSFFSSKTNPAAEKHPQTANKKDSTPEDKKTNFDFYSLLPKMEVLVPESELTSRTAKEKLKQTPGEKGAYFLQAGAFKDIRAADRMKAGLALLGIESKIESVKLDNGVWHRVRVGPFNDTQKLNKVRNLMKSNSISSIMVKVNS